MDKNEIGVIRHIMNADPKQSFWVEDAIEFDSPFIKDEQIQSVAAFPLYANNEHVGAMFFYYRRRHKFTDEEKGLFPILAANVAASILDAARLELVRRERTRFQAATAITEKVGISLDLDETLRKVITVLREQLFPNTHIWPKGKSRTAGLALTPLPPLPTLGEGENLLKIPPLPKLGEGVRG